MKTLKAVLLIVAIGLAVNLRAQTGSGDAHPAAGDSHPAKADPHPAAPEEVHPAFPSAPDTSNTEPLGGISAPQPFTTNAINPTTETPTGAAGGTPETTGATTATEPSTANPPPAVTPAPAANEPPSAEPTTASGAEPAPSSNAEPAKPATAQPAPATTPEPAQEEKSFSVPRYVPTP